MYIVDYHTHPFGHGEKNMNKSVYTDYIKQAIRNNVKELGFSDHDDYFYKIDWNLLFELKEKSDLKIKIGMEFDYIPEEEKNIRKKIEKISFDYCIGSVHKIGDWEFDHPAYKNEYNNRSIESIYMDYYDLLKKAVKSDLFDIIGHLDLIKIFNFKPENMDIMDLVFPVLKLIKRYKMVIELNINGLNKPVEEMYPSERILKKAEEMEIPITTGSDAHNYKRVGNDLKKAYNILTDIGYKTVATFSNHKLKQVSI
ncbi:MAG: histidinol-phosphatase [Bacillota bacterium]